MHLRNTILLYMVVFVVKYAISFYIRQILKFSKIEGGFEKNDIFEKSKCELL